MALARRLDGEILAADSMQVYRGLDLGTGKPSPEDRAAVPHHGLDLVAPQMEFTVAMYRRYARSTIQAIRARGRRPLMVAGTGLYLRAVIDGLCPAPPGNPAYRQSLIAEAERLGPAPLHGQLRAVDPAAAARIHPHDTRRIVRALEVHHLSRQPLSQWHAQTDEAEEPQAVVHIGLLRPREALWARIEARVRGMVAAGLVEEARRLYAGGVSRTAAQALGYRQLFAAFSATEYGGPAMSCGGAGRWSIDEAIEQTIRETRRYAKRQMTWFRRDARITWVTLEADEPADATAHAILALLGA